MSLKTRIVKGVDRLIYGIMNLLVRFKESKYFTFFASIFLCLIIALYFAIIPLLCLGLSMLFQFSTSYSITFIVVTGTVLFVGVIMIIIIKNVTKDFNDEEKSKLFEKKNLLRTFFIWGSIVIIVFSITFLLIFIPVWLLFLKIDLIHMIFICTGIFVLLLLGIFWGLYWGRLNPKSIDNKLKKRYVKAIQSLRKIKEYSVSKSRLLRKFSSVSKIIKEKISGFMFPWWFKFIWIGIIIVLMIVLSFFLTIYGININVWYGKRQDIEWLKSIIVSILENILFHVPITISFNISISLIRLTSCHLMKRILNVVHVVELKKEEKEAEKESEKEAESDAVKEDEEFKYLQVEEDNRRRTKSVAVPKRLYRTSIKGTIKKGFNKVRHKSLIKMQEILDIIQQGKKEAHTPLLLDPLSSSSQQDVVTHSTTDYDEKVNQVSDDEK